MKIKYLKFATYSISIPALFILSKKIDNPYYRIGIVGLLAQVTTDFLFHPIELINVRTKYFFKQGHTTLTTTKHILSTSGPIGYFRGGSVTLLGSSIGGLTYFTLYKNIKERIKKRTNESHYYLAYSLASTISELLVYAFYYPFEIIKTKIQSGQFNYKNFFDGLDNIYKSSDSGKFIPNLYQGMMSSLSLAMLTTFTVFISFELSRDYVAKLKGIDSSEVDGWDYFYCCLCSGLVSSSLLNFLEVYVIQRQVHGGAVSFREFLLSENLRRTLTSGLVARNIHGVFYTVSLLEFLQIYGDVYNVKI
jgi:hypothetical protein